MTEVPTSVYLEQCGACRGDGYVEERACAKCHASGVTPTEDGIQVLALMAWARVFGVSAGR